MKKAVFPGSFDPFTIGHESVVMKGAKMFDQVIVAVGTNTSKKYYFDHDQRIAMVESVFKDNDRIKVVGFEGLTVDFCKDLEAGFILRGLRDEGDFSYEKRISIMNASLRSEVQTVFVLTEPSLAGISSTILREILRNNGDISSFVPTGMKLD